MAAGGEPFKPSRRAIFGGAGAATAAFAIAESRTADASDPVTEKSSMPRAVSSAYSWSAGPSTDFTTVTSLAEAKGWNQGWFATSRTAASGPVNDKETAAYDPSNPSFDAQGVHFRLTDTSSKPGKKTYPHTGAQLNSYNLVSLTPGCWVEARMILPSNNAGIQDWPGFWLDGYDAGSRGSTKSWPQHGEIDIVEGLDGVATWHYHWGPTVGTAITKDTGRAPADIVGWHVFAAHWEKDRITIYYDGVQVGNPVTENVQSDPHYIILGHSTSAVGPASSEVICSSVRSWTHT